jgi:hypothetical protein
MATAAKIRTLQLRPIQSADLSFEVGGVLWTQSPRARLGQVVSAFDLSTFVGGLSSRDSADPAKLRFDADAIRTQLAPHALFVLRNDTTAVALRQSLVARENAFLQKYQHIAAIAQLTRDVFPADATDPRGKIARLAAIASLSRQHREAIDAAYRAAAGPPVVTEVRSTTSTEGRSATETFSAPITIRTTAHRISDPTGVTDVNGTQAIPQRFLDGDWQDLRLQGNGFLSEQTSTDSQAVKQTNSTRLIEFRHPALENIIADERVQATLQDEIHANSIFALQVPKLDRILENELSAFDLTAAQAQLRYLETFLLTPIPGVVTAVYKDIGETVQAAEPVLRIENRERLLLAGLVRSRAVIQLGMPAAITAKPFEAAATIAITGNVVSVRGHASDDDEWDVVIETTDVPSLPLNYQFDADTTTMTVG